MTIVTISPTQLVRVSAATVRMVANSVFIKPAIPPEDNDGFSGEVSVLKNSVAVHTDSVVYVSGKTVLCVLDDVTLVSGGVIEFCDETSYVTMARADVEDGDTTAHLKDVVLMTNGDEYAVLGIEGDYIIGDIDCDPEQEPGQEPAGRPRLRLVR
jgi:hypothetical protein